MMQSFSKTGAVLAALLLAAAPVAAQDKKAPSSWSPLADDASMAALMKAGFRDAGIVKTDRLTQDATQAFCSNPAYADSKEALAERAKIEAENLASVKYPADGKFLGDYKEGEKIAQSGRGLTYSDNDKVVNGGNCYNCHQISKAEISYGTIGPSLYNYGKTMGNTPEVQKRVWTKIYNSKAENACSNMPRAGHKGILSEDQIRHLVALLLDPKSPVNE